MITKYTEFRETPFYRKLRSAELTNIELKLYP